MLRLIEIKKEYTVGTHITRALQGVNIEFRKKEFVAVLGPSGCGKTTLLNIIGGLDRYDSGALYINDRPTAKFNDYDWDTYRNQSIGFVFQSYNLIMHQTVLNNVELALTLVGINKDERRKRAMEALESVGLSDQAYKKPNQLSGGQMQRVAIARALINNPDILLADEPTGALDTESSIQILNILKKLSDDRLVIMVTHNPELAQTYSTRIVTLVDGKVTNDSDPYETPFTPEPEMPKEKNFFKLIRNGITGFFAAIKGRREHEKKTRRTSMKYKSALKLSFNNLITKKMRTFLTSFAGSIGIIGIAIVLAISSGFNDFIKKTEENSLSRYPLVLDKSSMNFNMAISMLGGLNKKTHSAYPESNEIYINKAMANILSNITELFHENDLKSFKSYADENFDTSWGNIKYHYNVQMNIFYDNPVTGKYAQLNPFVEAMKSLDGMSFLAPFMDTIEEYISSMNVWDELSGNQKMLEEQYELLGGGRWPADKNELVLVVDEYNQITDMMLFTVGLLPPENVANVLNGDMEILNRTYSFDQIIGKKYKLMTNADYYYLDNTGNGEQWKVANSAVLTREYIEANSMELEVCGIVRLREGVSSGSIGGLMGYSNKLTEYLVDRVNAHPAVIAQKASKGRDIVKDQAISSSEYDEILISMGVSDKSNPNRISIYASSFESKDEIIKFIDGYNKMCMDTAQKGVRYVDQLAIMMGSINTITDAITWVLVAFSSISLFVSSIMIGIITYISVLERTKEIGILRSIGARKKDISRVFSAETFIIGFASGLIGVLITLLASVPINVILYNYLGIKGIAHVVWWHAIILVVISILLTLISGFIPSRMAANKDPVTALRSD